MRGHKRRRISAKKVLLKIIFPVLIISIFSFMGIMGMKVCNVIEIINLKHIDEQKNDIVSASNMNMVKIDEEYKNINSKKEQEYKQGNEKDQGEGNIKITFAGNVIFHMPQVNSAYNSKTKIYDFDNSFKNVKSIFQSSDLGVATVETTFVSGDIYSGYPTFNTPPAALKAIKNCGIGIVNFANNHIMDRKAKGFRCNIEESKKLGIDFIGIREDNNENNYIIKEADNIKVGIMSYVYETGDINGSKSINGIPIPNNVKGLVNTFNYNKLQELYDDVDINLKSMKNENVDFTVIMMHWGDEYSTSPNKYQKQISKKLNLLGVDAIIGGHPHVIQPYEFIKENGAIHETFVAYSLGNFISNQCYDTLKNRLTEDGYMVQLNIKKEQGGTNLDNYKIIPTWVWRQYIGKGGKDTRHKYEIMPLEEAINDSKKFNLQGKSLNNAQKSLYDIKSILKNN